MALGFREACKAGISFGKDDMVIADRKRSMVDETAAQVQGVRQQYLEGLITDRREVQPGGRCLVEVHRSGRHRNDEGDLRPTALTGNGRVQELNSIYMMATPALAASRRR